MKTHHKLAIAAGIPLTVVAGVAGSASAQVTPTTTPPTGQAADVTGWTPLIDSTGAIQVLVPPQFTDVSLEPNVLDSGTTYPQIKASTNLEEFAASFNTSGVIFSQFPSAVDPQAILDQYSPGTCGAETTEPYSDPVFQGLLRHQTQCGSAGAEYYTLAATASARPEATFIVEVGIASAAEQSIVDGVLASFNIAGGSGQTPGSSVPGGVTVTLPTVPTIPAVPSVPAVPTLPATTIPGATTPVATVAPATVPPGPTTPVGPTTPAGPASNPVLPQPGNTLPVASDAVELQDSTGHISIKVPPTWTSQNIDPLNLPTGPVPQIAASTDLSVFLPAEGVADTFGASGVQYTAQAYSPNPTVDYALSFPACTDAGVEQYFDGLFTGELHHYTNCGGTQTRVFTLHANPSDNSFSAVLVIQLTEADNAALDTVLGSFNTFEGSFAAG